jgi:molybdopterin molybdotransferase
MPAVELVEWKGSGDIAAMARGNCFLVLPEDSNHPEPDEIVRVLLY